MTPDRWRAITEIFHAALARDAAARQAFLVDACKDDASLRPEVDALLAAHQDAGSFGNAPAFSSAMRQLTPGTALGPYRIESLIGAGGMGEVYRGTDTRLGRTVAIKILPPHLRYSADLQARFEREARTISQLTHPHICTLHDVGHENDVDFLVMEHLEGQTLAARLSRGVIPLDQPLRIGIEIAAALDHAHRHGIVHRDLKPGNVMLTKSGAKLLDFGLAKLRLPAAAGGSAPTVRAGDTAEGTLLGTLPYMAPEQLEGKEADARSDMWALGCVLYELASGRKAFEGASQAGPIAAILERQPELLQNIQPLTPPALDHLVRTCLAKDREERWDSAADVMRELRWIAGASGVTHPAARSQRRGWQWVSLAAVSLLVVLGAASTMILPWRARPALRPAERFDIALPAGAPLAPASLMPLAGDKCALALSGDGSRLVYVGAVENRTQLFVRDMASGAVKAIPGTEGGHTPFFSPDGDSLAFFGSGRLQRVSLSGGMPIGLADAPSPWGGVWSADGTIVFNRSEGEGLFRVRDGGGPPQLVMKGPGILMPILLPSGLGLLASGSGVFTIKNGKAQLLLRSGFAAQYVPTGHLVYAVPGSLMAVPFDLSTGRPDGPPVELITDLRTAPFSVAQFAVSSAGTLVYARGRDLMADGMFVWSDYDGHLRPVGLPKAAYGAFTVSPDATRLAVQLPSDSPDGGSDIWLYELSHPAAPVRLTPRQPDRGPVSNARPRWTPDGAYLLYSSTRSDSVQLMMARADGSAPVSIWTATGTGPTWLYPMSFSPDGSTLAAFGATASGSYDMFTVRILEPNGTIRRNAVLQPLLNSEFGDAFPQFSPAGDAVAFNSDQSGQYEIFVSAYPHGERRCQVSRGGGSDPSWTPGGKSIIYQSGSAFMMANVHSVARCDIGEPRVLFSGPFSDRPGFGHDMTADGRLLLVQNDEFVKASPTLSVVTNFLDEVQRRAPRRPVAK